MSVSLGHPRRARFDELDTVVLYALARLRSEVFVVEQACVYLDLDGLDPAPTTVHWWIEDGGRPVSYLRVIDHGVVARIGRVLTAPSHRGEGLAGRLLRAVLTDQTTGPIELDAQSHLAPWYATFGFTVIGPEHIDDGLPHLPMRLTR